MQLAQRSDPIARPLSELLEVQPGGDHASTQESERAAGPEQLQPTSDIEQLADDASREKRYRTYEESGRTALLCNFVENGKQA